MKKSKEGHTHIKQTWEAEKKGKVKKKNLPILTYVKLAYMNKALL